MPPPCDQATYELSWDHAIHQFSGDKLLNIAVSSSNFSNPSVKQKEVLYVISVLCITIIRMLVTKTSQRQTSVKW